MTRLMARRAVCASVLLLCTISMSGQVYDLRCEGMRAPLGIDTTVPHFSWKNTLNRVGQRQTAYEIEVGSDSVALAAGNADMWQSGKVMSADQVMVPYEGKTLVSRQLCYWRLRTWDEQGAATKWSSVERFAVGILDGMRGEYIGNDAVVAQLRTTLNIATPSNGPVFAYLNSLGYHELFVNGQRVGDNVLQPAMSQLDKHSLIVTYDITPYIVEGDNEIIAWIGQGWYKTTTFKAQYGCPLLKAEICQLVDGSWQLLSQSDATWQGKSAGYIYTGNWYPLMFGGERVNANASSIWGSVKVYDVSNMIATPQLFEGNRITDHIEPVTLTLQDDGSRVIDFGRVVTGWLYVDFEGLTKGNAVTMEYSDYIPVGGTFESQGESDTYIPRGDDKETFCNRFHHHAFRYVRIVGATDFKAEALQISALPKTGDVASFACSDEKLNAIHDMIHYTMECLTFSGYMVDCPHLERMGYGGDGNSSTMTLQTMYDVQPTFMNWLSAWSDNVDADGSLPYVAPAGGGGGGPYWSGFFVKAPWRMYLNYGDRRPMERYYEQMKHWLDYVEKYTVDGLLQPWPDTPNRMWFLGDWLAPDGVDVGGESVIHANNCFISDCLANMTTMARLLGKEDDAQQFDDRRQQLNKAIHAKYYHTAGYYANGTPLDQAYALLAGVPETETQENRVVRRLVSDSNNKYGKHIAAGLFGVPIFTEWAMRYRQADLMADILRQPDYPGYLHMIANGATATWEYWDGQRSHVHNCYNGIGTWFYQAVAGIRPDVEAGGYRHFFIDPQYPSGVTWAEGAKPTPYGMIRVAWQREEGVVDVIVPVGTTATVYVPATSAEQTIYDGNRAASSVEGTIPLGYADGLQIFLIGAGHHRFAPHPTGGITMPKAKKRGKLTVTPNPVTDTLRWSADKPVERLSLYDAKGAAVRYTPVSDDAISLSGLSNGVYILAAHTPTGTLAARVVKR